MKTPTSKPPSARELAEAKRVAALHPDVQRAHPRTVKAEHSKLDHINTYGSLPEFYVDRPFTCRDCGAEEIWRAADQKYYYEEAKGHIDAIAVRCHSCRTSRKKRTIEPTAPPNGGPATQLGNSEATEGPPSVS
jgi:predicted RNA-binding Zn-ribbon protein involved in translation (DUF1610 family)